MGEIEDRLGGLNENTPETESNLTWREIDSRIQKAIDFVRKGVIRIHIHGYTSLSLCIPDIEKGLRCTCYVIDRGSCSHANSLIWQLA